jgi:hypothetical protein
VVHRRLEKAADIHRERGDDPALATTLRDLGGYWKGRGDVERACAAPNESITIADRLGDLGSAAAGHAYLGVLAAYQGDTTRARGLLERSVAVLRDRGGADETLRCLFFLATLECDAGDPAAARARYHDLMGLEPLAALPYTGGFALDGLARLAVAEGRPRLALRLAGAAAATHERLGTSAGPAYEQYLRRGLASAWRIVSKPVAEQTCQQGRDMMVAEAIAEGLRPAQPSPDAGLLSDRRVFRPARPGARGTQSLRSSRLARPKVHTRRKSRLLSAVRRTAAGDRMERAAQR